MVRGFWAFSKQSSKENRSGKIWFGKTTQNDVRVLAVSDGIFVARSIRRLTMPFDVRYFTELTVCPWECNYAALGHTIMHAKRVLAPSPAAATVDADLAPPPMLTASVPYTPDEAGIDPPTPHVGKALDTPQAGKVDRQASGASSSAPRKVIADDGPATAIPQGSSSSTSKAMDETSRPVHDRPEGDDTARAPKQMRMNVISYAEMHEDMEPDLSQEAFG